MNIIKKLLKPYTGLPKEVYVIFISRIINAMGVFIFPLLTLILTKKIGMSEDTTGEWIAVFGIIFMPAGLLGGKLTDTIGRKKIIIIFDSLGALSYLLCGFVEPSMTTVYLIALASVFMGIAQPAHDALIADVTTPENREGAYSLTYLGFNMGFALGPAIGGLLFENHLNLLFIGDALTAMIATGLILIFVNDTFEKSKNEKIGKERKLEQHVEGSVIKVLFSRPILIIFSMIMFGYAFVYSQWSFLMPLHTEANFTNEGAKLFGYIASFNGVIVMIFTAVVTAMLDKVKNIRKVVYGGLLYAIGLGLLGFYSAKAGFFIAVFIFTIGEIIVTISSTPFIVNHTPASHRGRVSAILPFIIGSGNVLGPVIIGKALNIITIATAWRYIGLIMLIYAMLMFLLEKNEKRLTNVD
ncbi:MFS transporter [Abyssisolibacter fermentans]|uniref:MFS transporter n=1 Tax=Abyssisolibacter fermentans TaxID=1766203 RepID=UPI0012E345BE|nr:MFS transporter [Abyssisolibacter fermentans]